MSDGNDQILGLLRDVLRGQDALKDEVYELRTAVAVDVAVSAQHRDKSEARFESIERTLKEDIKPQTDDFARMKTIGIGFLAITAMGGVTLGGFLMWAGDSAANAVRQWLRIP